jgi:hypothetical protein
VVPNCFVHQCPSPGSWMDFHLAMSCLVIIVRTSCKSVGWGWWISSRAWSGRISDSAREPLQASGLLLLPNTGPTSIHISGKQCSCISNTEDKIWNRNKSRTVITEKVSYRIWSSDLWRDAVWRSGRVPTFRRTNLKLKATLHGVTMQKTTKWTYIIVKTSNLVRNSLAAAFRHIKHCAWKCFKRSAVIEMGGKSGHTVRQIVSVISNSKTGRNA